MTVLHPAIFAAMTALSPTAPQPYTAIVEPNAGLRQASTVPLPVWMPQPKGPSSSSSTSSGTFTTLRSSATA